MEIAIITLFIIALILGAMLISQRITLKSEINKHLDKIKELKTKNCINIIDFIEFNENERDKNKSQDERQQKTNQAFAKALNEKSERIRELERELSDTLLQLRQTNEIHTMANCTIIELKKELEAEKAKQKYSHAGANEIEQDLREKPKRKKGKK